MKGSHTSEEMKCAATHQRMEKKGMHTTTPTSFLVLHHWENSNVFKISRFSGSMGSVSSLSMKLPMLIWLEDRCYATAICNETIQTFWWISSKRPPKINNDNHKRLSPAWWIVPYTVICEEVVNSIFVFFWCVLLKSSRENLQSDRVYIFR